MEPNLLGRKLGVGARVASKMLLDRATAPASASTAAQESKPAPPQAPVYAARGKGVAQGARNFGSAVWRPFAHASGVLWLEVTGLFFGIFTLLFAQNAWKLRLDWASGVNHQRFLVYAVVTLLFAYFTFSSFYRASRKQRRSRE